jgi:hypothetical protein
MSVTIRPIAKEDNAALAVIVRNSLAEFGANKPMHCMSFFKQKEVFIL